MSMTLKVYDNGDHTCLVWLPIDGKPIPNCRGFAIRRIKNGTQDYLHGFIGFSDTDKPTQPWAFPVQRYMWWDYNVAPADKVQYEVVPVTGPSKDQLTLAPDDQGSGFTEEMTVTSQCSPNMSAYFNRGIVQTQWVARALKGSTNAASLKSQITDPNNTLREALGGLALSGLTAHLQETLAEGGSLYAALYELNDPELIAGLKALGKRCHLILANGAFKSNTPPGNENSEARQALKNVVDLSDRMVAKGHFAHNKFAVFCNKDGKPVKVITGALTGPPPACVLKPTTRSSSQTLRSLRTFSTPGIASRPPGTTILPTSSPPTRNPRPSTSTAVRSHPGSLRLQPPRTWRLHAN